MAITDGNSVLLLGAGVSAPFQVPLGGDMIGAILKQLRSERTALRASNDQPMYNTSDLSEAYNYPEACMRFPIHAAIGFRDKNLTGNRFNQEEFRSDMDDLLRLEDRLNNQTSESIDDFIVQNPSISDLAKVAVASVIFTKSYRYDLSQRQVVACPLDARDTSALVDDKNPKISSYERNWIHHLINITRNAFYREPPSQDRKIKVITFNYDCILERVLEKQFNNTEHEYGHYSEYIEIAHVHGACGLVNDVPEASIHSLIRQWAANIHVVREQAVSDEVVSARELARQWISMSKRLHCVGFAFADANMKLLELDKNSRPIEVNFCNYNRSVGVKMNAEKYLKQSCILVENCNDDSRPLSVSDWFYTGFAGELPS